jgi:hypothetical protein
MPQAKVITQIVTRRGNDPELLMKIMIVPRGGGNRPLVRRLARACRIHPVIGDHVSRVKVGSSTLWVYLRPSFKLTAAIAMMTLDKHRRETADVPGQLPLFLTG